MKQIKTTYDTNIHKWVAYLGWVHLFAGSADGLDQWLDNSNEYEEYV